MEKGNGVFTTEYEKYQKEYNVLANAYCINNKPEGLIDTKTDIIMKNFKSLVKSTAKTQEVLCKIYPHVDSKDIADILKHLKDAFKGNNETYEGLFSALESGLVAIEKTYDIIRDGIFTNTNHEAMRDYIDATQKALFPYENGEAVITKAVVYNAINNPYLLAHEYLLSGAFGPDAVISTLLAFASRGYTNLDNTSLLALEAAMVSNCLNEEAESCMDYSSVRSLISVDNLLVHLMLINSVGSFAVNGKSLIPQSVYLDTLFTEGTAYINQAEIRALMDSATMGVVEVYGKDAEDCKEIISYYMSKLSSKPEVEDENQIENQEEKEMKNENVTEVNNKEEDNIDKVETEEVTTESNTASNHSETMENIKKAVKEGVNIAINGIEDHKKAFSEAASNAYDKIKTQVVEEVAKENKTTYKVLAGIGIGAICIVGGILGYKYLKKSDQ